MIAIHRKPDLGMSQSVKQPMRKVTQRFDFSQTRSVWKQNVQSVRYFLVLGIFDFLEQVLGVGQCLVNEVEGEGVWVFFIPEFFCAGRILRSEAIQVDIFFKHQHIGEVGWLLLFELRFDVPDQAAIFANGPVA